MTGANGAGKSTLLRVLAGLLVSEAGQVRRLSGAQVALLEQEESWSARCSPGERRRQRLAALLADRPDVLLLDEPTNHLAAGLVDQLTAAVRRTPAAVVIATHDRQLLSDLTDWPVLRLEAAPA